MKLKIAYSSCPNDTFAFHAMINELVDTEGIEFSVDIADVEQLNKRASIGIYDVCKLSYSTFFSICDKYVMLRAGSALGYDNGPLLVSLKNNISKKNLAGFKIAVPGEGTTGALLLRTAFPECRNLIPVLFSDIEKGILEGEFDAGVLIHEGRFTYRDKGLNLIEDLGNYWQRSTGLPIPLGGIAVSRSIENDTRQKINRILKRSIEFALKNPDKSSEYVCENAQEMNTEIQRKHINLFVNEYTLDIGDIGQKAVQALYETASRIRPHMKNEKMLFIE